MALSFKIEMRSAAFTRDSYSVRSSSLSTPSLGPRSKRIHAHLDFLIYAKLGYSQGRLTIETTAEGTQQTV